MLSAEQQQIAIVVHRVMERLVLRDTPGVLSTAARLLIGTFGGELSLEQRDVAVEILDRILYDPVLVRARSAHEHLKDVPFVFADSGALISGVIDMCFPLDDTLTRWCVVDWKADAPPEGSPNRAEYERMLACGGQALIKQLRNTVVEVELHVFGPHRELGV